MSLNIVSAAEADVASALGPPSATSPQGLGLDGRRADDQPLETKRFMEVLGVSFENSDLLEQALTHSSYKNENQSAGRTDNERLEYLGDAVLDLAMSEILVRKFADDREGSLSKKRASLVNEDVLAAIASEVGLPDLLRLGKGERQTGGLAKPRILASALEAVFGAVFLDSGFPAARAAAERAFATRLESMATGPDYAADFKTRLQETSQERFRLTPQYRVERERGPDHDKVFDVSVRIGDSVLAVGEGRNKKSAEQEAARLALAKLDERAAPRAEDEVAVQDAAEKGLSV